jgi:hypothetical protein
VGLHVLGDLVERPALRTEAAGKVRLQDGVAWVLCEVPPASRGPKGRRDDALLDPVAQGREADPSRFKCIGSA